MTCPAASAPVGKRNVHGLCFHTMSQAPTVVTIGNFDGVHRGHQALLTTAREMAAPRDAEVRVVTFTRHPISVLRPDEAPPMLMHPDQREAALRDAGADTIEWIEPSREILGLLPQQFVQWLVDEYNPVGMVEGPNFRFGRNRAGGPQELEKLGLEFGFEVRIIEPRIVALRDKMLAPVSSSLVRWLLQRGRVVDARLCLGRPFVMQGTVVVGERRGRAIGFPTVNLDTGEQMMPADGVYGGIARIDDRRLPAAISIGPKPTFHGRQRVCEAHLIDFDGNLYGRSLELVCCRWLRDQHRFPDAAALTAQLRHDIDELAALDRRGLLDPAALTAGAA